MIPKASQNAQLVIYFTFAYAISWLIWLPLYGPTLGIDGLPVLPFHHGIGGLGPMLAGFITTGIFEKKQGLKRLAAQMVRPSPLLYVAIALLSPFILAIAVAMASALTLNTPVDLPRLFAVKEFPEMSFTGFFLYNLVFFDFGEETGWRGFALPRLQARYNALWSAVILTLFWAVWHWPLFLYRPGYTGMGTGGIVGWIFSLLTGSVLLSWLYNSSRGCLLACAIFHATIDIAFMADFADQNAMNYLGMLITLWGIATVVIFRPKNLSRPERIRK